MILADRLNGDELDGDHGAPVRLVSPDQYGYVSTKHLARIELHSAEPRVRRPSILDALFMPHPRASVWREERHRFLPTWFVRPFFRSLKRPMLFISARAAARMAGDPRSAPQIEADDALVGVQPERTAAAGRQLDRRVAVRLVPPGRCVPVGWEAFRRRSGARRAST